MEDKLQSEYNSTSIVVDTSEADRENFGEGYRLRRHKYENLANEAILEARQDWLRLIGPIETFANANPYHGHFAALVLPFTKPERMRISAYFMEYAFLYDDICESANKALAMDPDSEGLVLNQKDSVAGAKQIQSKIMLELFDIDEPCGRRMIEKWKTTMSTARAMKTSRAISSLAEYVPLRGLDAGAPFVEAIMLFGLGIELSEQDDDELSEVVAPAYAALGLANDYFSFDREFAEFKDQTQGNGEGSEDFINAVWLCMRWHNLAVHDAKQMVRRETIKYEAEFSSRKLSFLESTPRDERLWKCLDGLSQMIIGNIVWSLKCPRYHPELRYNPNIGIENDFLDRPQPTVEELRLACEQKQGHRSGDMKPQQELLRDHYTQYTDSQRVSTGKIFVSDSISEKPALKKHDSFELHQDTSTHPERNDLLQESSRPLDLSIVNAPLSWCSQGPSKDVRTSFIDALTLWTRTPIPAVETIKSVVRKLHNASLLLDDIEDSSSLRRGRPAAHVVFGVPQTINAANFAIVEAMHEASTLSAASLDIFHSCMRRLFVGQSLDLRWTYQRICPTVAEYLNMVDGKTGGLFDLLIKLLVETGSCSAKTPVIGQFDRMTMLLGRLFQIRDDYQNLMSSDYGQQKGSCEDLDEGKYSYPLIEALSCTKCDKQALENMLAVNAGNKSLTSEVKVAITDHLHACGALDRTKKAILDLQQEVEVEIAKIEEHFHETNWTLRLLLRKLSI